MINPTNIPIKKNVMIPPLSFFILSPFVAMILNATWLQTTHQVQDLYLSTL